MGPDRRQWLERLVQACEGIVAREEADDGDLGYAAVLADVEALLARLRGELETLGD